jgi:hypothetical protein
MHYPVPPPPVLVFPEATGLVTTGPDGEIMYH